MAVYRLIILYIAAFSRPSYGYHSKHVLCNTYNNHKDTQTIFTFVIIDTACLYKDGSMNQLAKNTSSSQSRYFLHSIRKSTKTLNWYKGHNKYEQSIKRHEWLLRTHRQQERNHGAKFQPAETAATAWGNSGGGNVWTEAALILCFVILIGVLPTVLLYGQWETSAAQRQHGRHAMMTSATFSSAALVGTAARRRELDMGPLCRDVDYRRGRRSTMDEFVRIKTDDWGMRRAPLQWNQGRCVSVVHVRLLWSTSKTQTPSVKFTVSAGKDVVVDDDDIEDTRDASRSADGSREILIRSVCNSAR